MTKIRKGYILANTLRETLPPLTKLIPSGTRRPRASDKGDSRAISSIRRPYSLSFKVVAESVMLYALEGISARGHEQRCHLRIIHVKKISPNQRTFEFIIICSNSLYVEAISAGTSYPLFDSSLYFISVTELIRIQTSIP